MEKSQQSSLSHPSRILGISFGYHDSAVCLIEDGTVLAAHQEERWSRIKNDPSFPTQALAYILEKHPGKIDAIVFNEKPLLKFDRMIWQFLSCWPRGQNLFSRQVLTWLQSRLRPHAHLKSFTSLIGVPIHYVKHHESHAAAAFFTSRFNNAAVLTVDGVGEYECGGIYHGTDSELKQLEQQIFPHSWGLFYSAITAYLGFEVNEGEYKVMGLAPYGDPQGFIEKLQQLIKIQDSGWPRINQSFIKYPADEYLFNHEMLQNLFGFSPRKKNDPIEKHHLHLAAATQQILEEGLERLFRHSLKLSGSRSLAYSGGVALNCSANGKVFKKLSSEGLLESIHFIGACGDAGGALGAALYFFHHIHKKPRAADQTYPAWGAQFSDEEIELSLHSSGLRYRKYAQDEVPALVAQYLMQDKIIGLFHGASEFGPRALGCRSILADPRLAANWQRINKEIKFREDFRPFAPAVLEEKSQDYFDLDIPSPLMLLTAQNKTKLLPAVTHVNNSSRVQTVNKKDNSFFYSIIEEFGKASGVFCVLNTSFNTAGTPIVNSPGDAIRCFHEAHIDILAIGPFIVDRSANSWLKSEV